MFKGIFLVPMFLVYRVISLREIERERERERESNIYLHVYTYELPNFRGILWRIISHTFMFLMRFYRALYLVLIKSTSFIFRLAADNSKHPDRQISRLRTSDGIRINSKKLSFISTRTIHNLRVKINLLKPSSDDAFDNGYVPIFLSILKIYSIHYMHIDFQY